ncbi:MAG: fructose-1,6-bisphosphatase [Firmicutes bacterium]|nr:fructose-1,6-bisphosphatase [Bacillota bacterium]
MIKKINQNSIFISDPHGEHEEFFRLMKLAKDKLQNKVDNIFVLGDIYDRGPQPDVIMDYLINEESNVFFTWGNHDILWMGAALGCLPSIACTLRIAFAYNNFDLLHYYKINLEPLKKMAVKIYDDDSCERFCIKVFEENINPMDKIIAAKMHKAISIIQFKLEYGVLPEDRLLLGKNIYPLRDNNFPSVDKNNPFELTEEESKIISGLSQDFKNSAYLKKHIDFLVEKGSVYKVYNNKLMFHACAPIYNAKKIMQDLDDKIKNLYKNKIASHLFYQLWCMKDSVFFGKEKMTTFERFFIDDKTTHKEPLDEYFKRIDDAEFAKEILKEFGISEDGVIINGHIPVKKGESTTRSEGKRIVIDGGMAKSYQSVTGIKGMVMVEDNDVKCKILR